MSELPANFTREVFGSVKPSGPIQRRLLASFRPERAAVYYCAAALFTAASAFLFQPVRAWLAMPSDTSGWLVLALLPFFAWQRWQRRPGAEVRLARPSLAWLTLPLAITVALLRVVLEPFPAWPMAEWLYAASLAAIGLIMVRLWLGLAWVKHWAFLLIFAGAGLPWPSVIDSALIGPWRVILASGVAECCGVLGYPAVAQGTLIRLGHATMGIEDACGGIRSLQLAVIVGLAIGEYRQSRARGRLEWVVGALALALLCNALRLLGLTWICAAGGQELSERWHDPLAWSELGLLLAGLAALAIGLRWPAAQAPARAGAAAEPLPHPPRAAIVIAMVLLSTLIGSEAFTQIWFSPSADSAARSAWSAHLPRQRDGFEESAFTAGMQQLLGCQRHEFGHWQGADGRPRAGYVLEWDQGQTARFAVLHHNPAICLPMAGNSLVAQHQPVVIHQGSTELPFECSEFRDQNGRYFVYYLVWDLTTGRPFGEAGERPGEGDSWWRTQWREIAGRRRDLAIRVVTLAIYGAPDEAQANRRFETEIGRMIGA